MFDVFQNVLFGKKKSSAESDKEKTESDDFVVLGQTSNDHSRRASSSSIPSDFLSTQNPYSFLKDTLPTVPTVQKEKGPTMPLQDVPFSLNTALLASAKLDQIWSGMSPIINSINQYKPYQADYDFSLEKSVMAETTEK